MKSLFTTLVWLSSLQIFCFAQSVKPTNVYPSNLEENMYFTRYDAASNTIKGFHFLVLSDGNNSKDKTPEFTVKIYLYQEGVEPIFIKTFEEPGIWHMGSKEYKNIDVNLSEFEVKPGTYRVGVFVNADNSFTEDASDNATLFRDPITIGKSSKNDMARPFKKDEKTKKKKEDDEWPGDENDSDGAKDKDSE